MGARIVRVAAGSAVLGGVPAHGEPLEAPEEHVHLVVWREIGRDPQLGQASVQSLQGDAPLDARERRSDTLMNAKAEPVVPVGVLAADVERVGIREFSLARGRRVFASAKEARFLAPHRADDEG